MVRAHRASGNLLTIAVRSRTVEVDYGVLTTESPAGELAQVVDFTEKPKLDFTVSMGIYVLEPGILDFIPEDRYFDFPDLVKRLLADEIRIGAFPFDGLWLDIGRQEDYDRAVALLEEGDLGLLDDAFDPPERAGRADRTYGPSSAGASLSPLRRPVSSGD